MRISGGDLKGRRLPGRVPRGVRPTSSRVREALFDVIGNDLTGWTVLDATGGSGLMAMEAASRGAAAVEVVELRGEAVRSIKAAVSALDLTGVVHVRRGDALRLCWEDQLDLVLADPPYGDPLAPWVAALAPVARRWLVVEHSRRLAPPPAEGLVTRRYGDTALSFYAGAPRG